VTPVTMGHYNHFDNHTRAVYKNNIFSKSSFFKSVIGYTNTENSFDSQTYLLVEKL